MSNVTYNVYDSKSKAWRGAFAFAAVFLAAVALQIS